MILDEQQAIKGQCSNNEHQYSSRCQSLVKILNPDDNYCLAREINVGIKYWKCGEDRMHPDFITYWRHQDQHQAQAEALLSDAGIPTTKTVYGVKEAKKIQQLLNRRYGEWQVRLVIFSNRLHNRIAWKGWTEHAAAYNLCLYHESDHFGFIGSPQQLLKVRLLL